MFPLTRWSPGRDMLSFRMDMDDLFNRVFGRERWPVSEMTVMSDYPALDVAREGDNVIVRAALPGIDPKDVDITVTGNLLTIKGEIKEEKKIEEGNYFLREIGMGEFERSITLPVDVDADKVKANYHDGFLDITLPAQEALKGKKVEITTEEPKKLKAA